jgi:hypothetical protein
MSASPNWLVLAQSAFIAPRRLLSSQYPCQLFRAAIRRRLRTPRSAGGGHKGRYSWAWHCQQAASARRLSAAVPTHGRNFPLLPEFDFCLLEDMEMGKRWTDEDVDDLKELARKHPVPKIAEMMDRTVGGVLFKAHKLKVSLKTRTHENDRVGDPGAAGRHLPGTGMAR